MATGCPDVAEADTRIGAPKVRIGTNCALKAGPLPRATVIAAGLSSALAGAAMTQVTTSVALTAANVAHDRSGHWAVIPRERIGSG